jgi:hypothetical protein
MNKHLDYALNRLSKINWIEDEQSVRNSYSKLVWEYLRRISLLIQRNSIEIFSGYPFVSITSELGGNTIKNLVELCPYLYDIRNTYTATVCEGYIEWAMLIDEGNPVALECKDLYEPLIKLFERGCINIGKHGGCISIGASIMPIPALEFTASKEPIDISDKALDEYDSE